jgi:L,D-peptidoglycan transpeptidase YkuD (ErfK/YbiS/YcfS/YnhG family)
MGNVKRIALLGITLVALLGVGGCSHLRTAGEAESPAAAVARAIDGGDIPANQLLVVISEEESSSRATLFVLERSGRGWKSKGEPIRAMIGRAGFAAPGGKREGDGHTPTGLFPLESVFGYAPTASTSMPYRQATENDLWVDDIRAPDYNNWVKRGETSATSFEVMKVPTAAYRHGVVIGYNRNPVVSGQGSAIFLHVWREGQATSGCVALDEQQLVDIIAWLDPRKRPMILMGTRDRLAVFPGLAGLAGVTGSGLR